MTVEPFLSLRLELAKRASCQINRDRIIRRLSVLTSGASAVTYAPRRSVHSRITKLRVPFV